MSKLNGRIDWYDSIVSGCHRISLQGLWNIIEILYSSAIIQQDLFWASKPIVTVAEHVAETVDHSNVEHCCWRFKL